jgi:hypothetical protein
LTRAAAKNHLRLPRVTATAYNPRRRARKSRKPCGAELRSSLNAGTHGAVAARAGRQL